MIGRLRSAALTLDRPALEDAGKYTDLEALDPAEGEKRADEGRDLRSLMMSSGPRRTGVLAAVGQGAGFPPQRSRRLLQLLLQDDLTQVGLNLRRGAGRRTESS